MRDLTGIVLKVAAADPTFRGLLLREIQSVLVRTAAAPPPFLQKYYDHMIGPKKKWPNPTTGREVGFWVMLKADQDFKAKYLKKAKTWWDNQQVRETKDPSRMKVREVSNTVESQESEVKSMIRGLETGKKRTKDVRETAQKLQRGVGTLAQRAKRMTKGVKRDRLLHRIDRLTKRLEGLAGMGTRKDAPKLVGRKCSS